MSSFEIQTTKPLADDLVPFPRTTKPWNHLASFSWRRILCSLSWILTGTFALDLKAINSRRLFTFSSELFRNFFGTFRRNFSSEFSHQTSRLDWPKKIVFFAFDLDFEPKSSVFVEFRVVGPSFLKNVFLFWSEGVWIRFSPSHALANSGFAGYLQLPWRLRYVEAGCRLRHVIFSSPTWVRMVWFTKVSLFKTIGLRLKYKCVLPLRWKPEE